MTASFFPSTKLSLMKVPLYMCGQEDGASSILSSQSRHMVYCWKGKDNISCLIQVEFEDAKILVSVVDTLRAFFSLYSDPTYRAEALPKA